MIYLEFGWWICFNVSFGIDYGMVVFLIVFGFCVNVGVIGDNLEIFFDVDN